MNGFANKLKQVFHKEDRYGFLDESDDIENAVKYINATALNSVFNNLLEDTKERAKERSDMRAIEQVLGTIIERVNDLPPAHVRQAGTGRWIWTITDNEILCKCSSCETEFNIYDNNLDGENFCPHCGTGMKKKKMCN